MPDEFENKTPREALAGIVGRAFTDAEFGRIMQWVGHYYVDLPTGLKNRYGRTPNEWSGHIVRSVRTGREFTPFEEWGGDEPDPRPYEEWLGGDSDQEPRFYHAGVSWEESIRRIVREELKRINYEQNERSFKDEIAKPLLSEQDPLNSSQRVAISRLVYTILRDELLSRGLIPDENGYMHPPSRGD